MAPEPGKLLGGSGERVSIRITLSRGALKAPKPSFISGVRRATLQQGWCPRHSSSASGAAWEQCAPVDLDGQCVRSMKAMTPTHLTS